MSGDLGEVNEDLSPHAHEMELLADDALSALAYRLGTEFTVYIDGGSRAYVVTEVVVSEEGRRLTYGVPKDALSVNAPDRMGIE